MKKILLIAIVVGLFLAMNLNVQAEDEVKQGTITYEQVIKLQINLVGEAAQFAHLIPKERRSEKVLYFNEKESLYVSKKNETEETKEAEFGMVMMKMQEPDNKTYSDLVKMEQVEQREFMTRMFLIDGKVDGSKWKLTGKQKKVLDMPCQEATMEDGEDNVVAWFTPVIPVFSGPSTFAGLPGMVLEVSINDGEQIITAKALDKTELDENIFAKPKKGKKVTDEEFKKIVDEKRKEMGGAQGSNVMVKVIRQ